MSVYFITCRELGKVKIGYSNNPKRRFQFLKTGSPAALKLEAVIPASEANEKHLHATFCEYRQHGEWFSLADSIDALIALFPVKLTKIARRISTPSLSHPLPFKIMQKTVEAVESGEWTKTSLAKAADLSPNALRLVGSPDWSPSITTMKKLSDVLCREKAA